MSEWINGKCSNCGAEVATNTAFAYLPPENQHYCYNCGARMDENYYTIDYVHKDSQTTATINGGVYKLKPIKFEGDTIINGGEY